MNSTLLLLFLACLPGAAQGAKPLPALPAAEARKLRVTLGAGLASNEERDWQKGVSAARALQAKYERASLLEVLAEGPLRERGLPQARKVGKKKEEFESFGQVTTGYAFECDGRIYRYALDLPRDYDGTRPFGLLIDPGHGAGANLDQRGKADYLPYFRAQLEQAGLDDWLVARTEIVEQVGAGGTLGQKPEDEVARIFAAFRRDVLTRCSIDPQRVLVAGLSQTGFWSWYLGRELGDRLAGIAPMGAVTWGVEPALENLLHVPTFVIHGAQDGTCPVAQPRATSARMRTLGLPCEYLELPDAGHDFGTWSHLFEGLRWLAARPRVSAPQRVVKVAGTLENPWGHWLRLDALTRTTSGQASAPPGARAEARIDGQRIEVRTEGVERLSLWLSPDLLDLEQPLTVLWNGAPAFEGRVTREFATAVAAALERCDWRFLPEARIELR